MTVSMNAGDAVLASMHGGEDRRVGELDMLAAAGDAMSVQRSVLDVAARNVAAAQASTPQHPYPRLVARFTTPSADDDSFDPDLAGGDAAGSRFAGTVASAESADALTEMIAVLDAQRSYEADASVFDVGKKLAERTLDLGRG